MRRLNPVVQACCIMTIMFSCMRSAHAADGQLGATSTATMQIAVQVLPRLWVSTKEQGLCLKSNIKGLEFTTRISRIGPTQGGLSDDFLQALLNNPAAAEEALCKGRLLPRTAAGSRRSSPGVTAYLVLFTASST
jgi:hypothetical protein